MPILNKNFLKLLHPLITVPAAVKQVIRDGSYDNVCCHDDQCQSVQTTVAPLKVVKHLAMTPPLTVVKGKQPIQSVQQICLPTGRFSWIRSLEIR